jgi:hypothetical protein
MVFSGSISQQIDTLKAQYAARATLYALATRQAVAVVNGQTTPGIRTHIDIDGAVVGADTALHTARGVGHNLRFG